MATSASLKVVTASVRVVGSALQAVIRSPSLSMLKAPSRTSLCTLFATSTLLDLARQAQLARVDLQLHSLRPGTELVDNWGDLGELELVVFHRRQPAIPNVAIVAQNGDRHIELGRQQVDQVPAVDRRRRQV